MKRYISKPKTILAFLIAVVASLPIGWIVAMLLTPTLWRMESILKMELAGHSGPSEWVFIVIWAVIAVVLFLALRGTLASSKSDQEPPNDRRRTSNDH
jgi:CDP-diglyceride synthetase